jgi:hypothetical protein
MVVSLNKGVKEVGRLGAERKMDRKVSPLGKYANFLKLIEVG